MRSDSRGELRIWKCLPSTKEVTIERAVRPIALTNTAFFATFLTTNSIAFSGSGYDPEDGSHTGGSLVWTSNIDGVTGSGTSFAHTLSAGAQVITLTIKDSEGATGHAIRTFRVTTFVDPGDEDDGSTVTPTPEPTATPTPTPTPPPYGNTGGGPTGGGPTGNGANGSTAQVQPAPSTATPIPPPTAVVPAASPAPPAPSDGNGSALPAGAIALFILLLIAILAVAIYYDVRRRRGQLI